MPRIPVHLPDPKLPQPIATPEAFGAGIGRAVQDLGQTLTNVSKQIDDFRTQNQISQLNEELTEAQADLSILWKDSLSEADPFDENLSADFMRDVVTPRLQEITDEIAKTQRARFHATGLASSITASFEKSTLNGMVELSGAAAASSLEVTIKQLSTRGFTDPASLPDLIQQAKDTIASQEGLDPVSKIKMLNAALTDIAYGAASGAIERFPERAAELLDKGALGEHLTGRQIATLLNSAQAAVSARNISSTQASVKAGNASANSFLDLITDETGNLVVSEEASKFLRDDPALNMPENATLRRVLTNMYNTILLRGDKMPVNQILADELWRRAGLPFSDSNRLTYTQLSATVGHGIDVPKYNQILRRINRTDSPRGQTAVHLEDNTTALARGTLTIVSLVNSMPMDARAFTAWHNWALLEAEKLVLKGEDPIEIWGAKGSLAAMIEDFRLNRKEIQALRLLFHGRDMTPEQQKLVEGLTVAALFDRVVGSEEQNQLRGAIGVGRPVRTKADMRKYLDRTK